MTEISNDKQQLKNLIKYHDYISGEKDLKSNYSDIASNKMPSWTESNQNERSNFQLFLNHGIMKEIEDLNNKIIQAINNSYIDTADTDMMFMSFKVNVNNIEHSIKEIEKGIKVTAKIDNIDLEKEKEIKLIADTAYTKVDSFDINTNTMYFQYKGKKIKITTKARKYLESHKSEEEYCYYNDENNYLYFQQEYDYQHLMLLDQKNNRLFLLTESLIPQKIWNIFDEEGLMHDLKRLPEESNESFKQRIMDKTKNPASSIKKDLKRHIERELGVSNFSYRKSEKIDKEVAINSLSDDAYTDQLNRSELEDIANTTREKIKMFWGETFWDNTYWDIHKNHLFKVIPFKTDI